MGFEDVLKLVLIFSGFLLVRFFFRRFGGGT